MDTVRFGRALGLGARGAAKAFLMAADAAVASKPAAATPVKPHMAAAKKMRETGAGLARGGSRFKEGAWRPFVRLGGVLWLELTGVFFGLFVLFAGVNAWKLRGNLRDTLENHPAHLHLLWSLAMTAVFGYFCVSSFVRARRRGRGR